MPSTSGTPAPWSYFFIRLLFKFVLKVFYGTIVVENAELIPKDGEPCIVCSNHGNSLTDPLLLSTAIPSKIRSLLRLTAKATQFGKPTFTSWLIESAGTVPIMRPKDYGPNVNVDNTAVMGKLMEALELGDAVCLFPEGASRYHPAIAPLKTGVARLLSDVLSRNRDDPDFTISILPCSITFTHRQHWRSDVLITFHPPMRFTPSSHPHLLAPVDFSQIRLLTAQLHSQLSRGTLDSPTWDLTRAAKAAARIYAPYGTEMTLGDYIRVTRSFLDALKHATPGDKDTTASSAGDTDGDAPQQIDLAERERQEAVIRELTEDLNAYQSTLARTGVKDDRVRRKPQAKSTLIKKMILRGLWALVLFIISLPGLIFWVPVMLTTFIAVKRFKKTGPVFDTYDEIAQYKLIYGLASGVFLWVASVIATFPASPLTFFAVPLLAWLTLRWMEDAVSAARACLALVRLLRLGDARLAELRVAREELHGRVMLLAAQIGLPEDPEAYYVKARGSKGKASKGQVKGAWGRRASYFSLRRRRKRDWNETMRWYDKVDYPEDDSMASM